MELRELRAFVAVVEDGGMSAAARRLHLSQPSLSQTIRALEREFAVTLLVRSSTGVTPTAAGRTLLDEARAVLARVDALAAAVSAHGGGGGGGVLRLGVPLELPGSLLPHVLAEMRATRPEVRVVAGHASSAAQLAALAAGELDVALVRELPVGQDVDTVLLVEEPLGVLMADAQCVDDEPVRLERLAGSAWIGFAREDGPAWWDEVAAVLRRHGHGVPVSPDNVPLIAEVKLARVAAGDAFAFAPPGWTQPLPDGVGWRPLLGAPLVRRTWAAWPAASRRPGLAALLAAFERNRVSMTR